MTNFVVCEKIKRNIPAKKNNYIHCRIEEIHSKRLRQETLIFIRRRNFFLHFKRTGRDASKLYAHSFQQKLQFQKTASFKRNRQQAANLPSDHRRRLNKFKLMFLRVQRRRWEKQHPRAMFHDILCFASWSSFLNLGIHGVIFWTCISACYTNTCEATFVAMVTAEHRT